MALHLLFGDEQLSECLLLLSAKDTLIVMTPVLAQALKADLSTAPCRIVVLHENDNAIDGADADWPRISAAEWIAVRPATRSRRSSGICS